MMYINLNKKNKLLTILKYEHFFKRTMLRSKIQTCIEIARAAHLKPNGSATLFTSSNSSGSQVGKLCLTPKARTTFIFNGEKDVVGFFDVLRHKVGGPGTPVVKDHNVSVHEIEDGDLIVIGGGLTKSKFFTFENPAYFFDKTLSRYITINTQVIQKGSTLDGISSKDQSVVPIQLAVTKEEYANGMHLLTNAKLTAAFNKNHVKEEYEKVAGITLFTTAARKLLESKQAMTLAVAEPVDF